MDNPGKIVFEIKNRHPLELLAVTQSLYAFAKEYESFASESFEGPERSTTKLLVKEMRTGSIVTELVPYAAGMLPLLSEVKSVFEFVNGLKTIVEWLRAPNENQRPPVTKNTLTNIHSIVEPIAKDSANQLNIHSEVHNHAPVYININSDDANSIQNRILAEIGAITAPVVGRHTNVVMYWWQARNDTSQTGDRVIIESISKRPVKVVFESEQIKADILKIDENLFKHAFIVDVDVETVEGKPALYKVVTLHEEIER